MYLTLLKAVMSQATERRREEGTHVHQYFHKVFYISLWVEVMIQLSEFSMTLCV